MATVSKNIAPRGQKEDIELSKFLSKLLRHRADDFNLKMDSNGYCRLDDVIRESSRSLKRQKVTGERIEAIVKNCPKQRFKITTEEGVMKIRANQGHTLKSIESMELREIANFADGRQGKVIHGTSRKAWESIKTSGLNKMKRLHIHMARGEFGDAISGARMSSQIIITINANKAINDGLKFYESENGVILSPGDDKGAIHPKYFTEVYDRTSKKVIFP